MSAQVNSRTTLHRGRIFRLVRENVTLENGVVTELDVIRHPGAAAIVPFSGKNRVLLIRQYRHAVGGYIWEIPAGTVDSGESALACAKRELIEETGFSAEEWVKLGEITPLPAYSDERIHLYGARKLTPATRHLDEDEIVDVHEMPFGDALSMVGKNEIQDAKTISGLFLANLQMKD